MLLSLSSFLPFLLQFYIQPYASHPELPKFNGELLMDVHGTGCYTSQAAMKLYNCQNELLGDAAERFSVVAEWLNQASYSGTALTENWRRVPDCKRDSFSTR